MQLHRRATLTCINVERRAGSIVPVSKTNDRRGPLGTTYTMSTNAIQHEGKSFPLEATLAPGGANFSVFA
jgi:hypothetical protein